MSLLIHIRLWRVYFSALFLDILSLDPISTSAELEEVLIASRRSVGIRERRHFPIIAHLVRILKICFESMFEVRHLPSLQNATALFVAGTHNQVQALKPICDRLHSTHYWFDSDELKKARPLFYVRSLPFFPLIAARACTASKRKRTIYSRCLPELFRIYGTYVAFRSWLREHRPSCVVFSNDHVGVYLALNKAAQDENIKTVYVQHACVTSDFPLLPSDIALLDGGDAAMKYKCDTKLSPCAAFLVGISKAPEYREKDATARGIGVAYNLVDTFDFIRAQLSFLVSSFPDERIVVRLHPSTPSHLTNSVVQFCSKEGIDLSNALLESTFEYARSLDVLVCGASSIVLEAAMVHVPTVAFFGGEIGDHYQFVENHLCWHATTFEQLRRRVVEIRSQKQTTDMKKKVSYYSAGFGDPSRPPSSTLAASIIDDLCRGKGVSDCWKASAQFGGNVWEWQPEATHCGTV